MKAPHPVDEHLLAAALSAMGKLAPSSQALYRSTWRAWERFCLAQRLSPVDHCTEHAVQRYVDGALAHLAPGTRARYCRTLARIHRELRVAAPAALRRRALPTPEPFAQHQARTGLRERPSDSTAFLPAERAQLLRALASPDHPWLHGQRDRVRAATDTLRARLLVALLLAEGLTLAECLALQLRDVGASASGRLTLDLTRLARRACQRRTVALEPLTAQLVRALSTQQLASHGAQLLPAQTLDLALLASAERSAAPGTPMSRHAAFRIVQTFLDGALRSGAIKRSAAEHGPSCLRNSALLAWLEDGAALGDVLLRAGLQRHDALQRLSALMTRSTRARVQRAGNDNALARLRPSRNA